MNSGHLLVPSGAFFSSSSSMTVSASADTTGRVGVGVSCSGSRTATSPFSSANIGWNSLSGSLRSWREPEKSGLPFSRYGFACMPLREAGDLRQLAVRADDQFEHLRRESLFGVPVAEVNQLLVARRAHRFRTGLALVIPPHHCPVDLRGQPRPGFRFPVFRGAREVCRGPPEVAGAQLLPGVPGENPDREVGTAAPNQTDRQIQAVFELLQRLPAGEGNARDSWPGQDPIRQFHGRHEFAAVRLVRFGILAAGAGQRAALQEYNGPNPGPVDRTTLDLCVNAHHITCNLGFVTTVTPRLSAAIICSFTLSASRSTTWSGSISVRELQFSQTIAV